MGIPLRNQVGYTIKSSCARGLKVWIIDPLPHLPLAEGLPKEGLTSAPETWGRKEAGGAAEGKLSGYTWSPWLPQQLLYKRLAKTM